MASSSYALSSTGFRCDECGQEMAFPLFCDRCGADYPERRKMNPFALLGLPARFDLDAAELERRELLLSQRLHPDLWQGKGDALYRKALLAQSALNEALGAVREAFARGETLWKLRTGDDAPSQPNEISKDFLIEQLEIQEEIETGLSEERKQELARRVRAELKDLQEQLAAGFSLGDAEAGHDFATATEPPPRSVRAALDRARYWRNVRAALRGQAPH
jgi:molecular chaperone HscB